MESATFTELMARWNSQPVWERRKPIPGLRHNTKEKFVPHRFPIKDGLTHAQVLEQTVLENNAFLQMLRRKSSTA